MSKNAITVIDQELIDYFESHLSLNDYDRQVRELFTVAKDLIEINTELTKREQKYRLEHNMLAKNFENAVDSLAKKLSFALYNDSGLNPCGGMIDLHQVRCKNEIMSNFYSFNAVPILKGDSDE